MKWLMSVITSIFLPMMVYAANVSEAPEEARVRDVAAMLRCPVCQSENILDSQASTAKEMVVILRERVAEGMTDEQIFTYFKSRYGDYVLLSPPTNGVGRVIWLIPFWLIAIGLMVFGWTMRRTGEQESKTRSRAATPLTESSLKELDL
jgi:cytochrome c-type biogenesis protein CcmH